MNRNAQMKSASVKKTKKYWRRTKKVNVKISPRNRWRWLIRKVIRNLGWMVDVQPTAKRTIYTQDKKEETEVITQYEKFLMFKDPMDRKEEELNALAKKLSAYKSFRKYSISLRVSLLRRAKYVAYKNSIELIRQGQYMSNMYVLVKGSGIVILESIVDGRQEKDVTNLREGYMCGELPLLYDRPSMTKVVTDGPSEWLMMNKHYFLMYAKDELKKQYFDVKCALNKFSFFDKITFFEMREFCVSAEIQKNESNTVLPLYEGTVGLTYFILEGRCSVLQKVVMIKDHKLRYPGYKLHPDQETSDPAVEKFIIRTCCITRRGIFGLGEEACKWVIVTDTDCEFMVIPRFMLLKYGRNMIWERLKDQLTNAYPSLNFIHNQFNYLRRWDKYKFHTSRLYTRGLSGNSIHNVPLMARCNEIIPEDDDVGVISLTLDKKTTDILNMKASIKTLEQYPALRILAAYLPKDEIIM